MQEGRVIPERLSITVRPPDIPSERRYPPSFRTARTLRMSAIRLIDGDLASNAKEPHPFHFPVEESFLRSALAPGRQTYRSALRSARPDPTGDLLGRQAGRRGAAGRCGSERVAAAPDNGGEVAMWESFFGFKKTPFGDSPDAKQLFASQAWNQVKTRLEFLAQHHGVGLITGEVGAGNWRSAKPAAKV